ncbi:MAG: T9SS type A sorting domain-containing protein [Gemmatimonadetes bacterium]|nr:T9SS type A sorting domain-containing protein [Gemmatimonadota bacterium]MYF16276.1 T9SS type A sorting domain-containing protein [Gemmatimonadota bacterium]
MFLKRGLLFFSALAFLAFAGQASAGPNANATVTIDLITDGGAGNQMDDGVHSGNVSGQGTKIAVEVFAKGVTTSLVGAQIIFDFDAAVLKYEKGENSAFLGINEATGVNLASITGPVALPESGFLVRAEFSTVADVTGKEFYLGIKSVTLAESAASTDIIAPEMMAMMSTINFNIAPKLQTATPIVPVPPGGMGKAVVMAVNFPADATITFDVQGEMIEMVQSMQDGATLTLTASGPAKAVVTASDGMTTTDPITIVFAEVRLPALDAVVGMDMMNMMDDGTLSASAGANEEIAIEVFVGDVEGGVLFGGASIVFAVDPAAAAMVTGFAPAEGLTLLGMSNDNLQVDIGSEEGVMLANGGYVGTLKLMTGAEEMPFAVGVASMNVLLGSGEAMMLPFLPAPVLYNHGPALDVSPGLINTIPRGGTAVVTITAVRFPEGATVTFTVELQEGVGDDPQSTIEHSVDGNVLTLTAAGYVSSVVKVTASDGMMEALEVTIQFTEQVAVELSSFVGSVVEDRVVINWTTASQTNNAGFRVLRSTDGETYEAVSELIVGAGTTDQLMDYMFEDNSLPAAEIVYYVLEQIDLDGTVNLSNPIEVLLGARFTLPTEFSSAVYPNPFNPRTTISYELPTDTAVSVIIYDAIGQEIRQLVSQHYTAGRYSVQWDAKDHMGRSVGSGVYIAKIKAGPNTAIQKMLLLK